MALPVGSKWLLKRERVPDQKIEVTSSSGAQFAAKYIEIKNPSEFVGEIWTREVQALNLKQHDPGTGYVAFQIGVAQVRKKDKYEGSWCDNAGNVGQFSLTKL